jgi:ligand-binding SRPBCC domain-containing protein
VRVHVLEREQLVPASLDEVFAFFSDAANLDAMTPGWLHFRILSPLPIAMRSETRIEYRLRLAGLPLRWRTRIARWDPPRGFVDVQESGPYALWEHQHVFQPCDGGVLMADVVRYAPPLGPLGELVHQAGVRAALAAIFDHRFAHIRERFGSPWRSDRASRP